MIDRVTFERKVFTHQDKFHLDYDFNDAENVFIGSLEDMTVRVFEKGKATVEYHGVVRRVTGDHGELFRQLLEIKVSMMQSAFGKMTKTDN